MKLITIIMISLFIGVLNASESAAPLKTKDLFLMCNGSKEDIEKCQTYISGVREGMKAQRLFMRMELVRQGSNLDKLTKILLMQEPFCPPKSYSDKEYTKTFLKLAEMIKDNPEKMDANAAFTSIIAASHEFPCGASIKKMKKDADK